MAEKSKVKWYDTFNPFAHIEANKKKTKAKKKAAKKTIPVDHEKILRDKRLNKATAEVAKRAAKNKKPYQGTPVGKTRVVKPKKKD